MKWVDVNTKEIIAERYPDFPLIMWTTKEAYAQYLIDSKIAEKAWEEIDRKMLYSGLNIKLK